MRWRVGVARLARLPLRPPLGRLRHVVPQLPLLLGEVAGGVRDDDAVEHAGFGGQMLRDDLPWHHTDHARVAAGIVPFSKNFFPPPRVTG